MPTHAPTPNIPSDETIIAHTRDWLEKAVIGLNLCPFAKPVLLTNRIRFVVSQAKHMDGLLEDLERELHHLHNVSEKECETTLLIHPMVFGYFLAYNDFLDVADSVIEEVGMDGELQIASFHPQYQFAETEPNDIENFTNRSPYPTLHLLRESSVERAIESYGSSVEKIYQTNIETLKQLGHEGWDKLGIHTNVTSNTTSGTTKTDS
jgi:uncharacterized protein